MFYTNTLYFLLAATASASAYVVDVNPPPAPPNNTHVVYSNYFGISLELAYIQDYFGNSTTNLPSAVMSYFKHLLPGHDRPLRLRIGGNSMDDSIFVPTQQEMITFTGVNATQDDQPTTYGPLLFNVLNAVNTTLGGIQWMMGLSLRDPTNANNTLLAAYAEYALGSSLDALLLGNEPDLYQVHVDRPHLVNYTTQDYFEDFNNVTLELANYPQGSLLTQPILGGPTICCEWDLNSVITDGYISRFGDDLKYITLQHYPQNNCGNNTKNYPLEWYLGHNNTVWLANWQSTGLTTTLSTNTSLGVPKPVLMTEFNTVSCGGLPGISDTFGAALWVVDYVLQLATVGYAGAYMHTREWDVSYSMFFEGGDGALYTRPVYYSYLPVLEALNSTGGGGGGSHVVDLNVNGSVGTTAGYAIYDDPMESGTPDRVVLINFSDSPVTFSLGAGLFETFRVPHGFPQPGITLTASVLTAPDVEGKGNVTWLGRSLLTSGEWSGEEEERKVYCKNGAKGCDLDVETGVAVVRIQRGVSGALSRALKGRSMWIWMWTLVGLVVGVVFDWL